MRQDLVERFRAASLLGVPLRWGGEVRFVAIAHHARAPRLRARTRSELAETLANQAAVAFARLEVERSRAARAEHDAALTRAAISLNASLELVEVLETLSREADLAVGGSMAGVYLADGSGGGVATAGHNTPDDWKGLVMARGEGIAGRVLETGLAFVTNAYQEEIELPPHPALRRLKTAVGVPMAWNGELKGALSVGFAEMRRVTDDDLRALEAIAALAVAACRNAEAYEQASHAAITDALTGLLNHGALHLRMREEISRARRTGARWPACCWTSTTSRRSTTSSATRPGDGVLRKVATALRGELRDHDVVARYGGDEFVVLLPDTDGRGRPARRRPDRGRAARRVLDRARAVGRAAVGRRAARARRPRAAAGQAHGQAARGGRERRRRARARADGGPRRLARGHAARVLGDGRRRRVGPRRAADPAHLPAPRDGRRGGRALRARGERRRRAHHLHPPSPATRARRPSPARAWRPAPRSASDWRSARSPGARWPLLLAALDLESTAGDRDTPAGSFAVFPLLHAGRPQGLIMLRAQRDMSPERVRLIEGLARQTMAIFGAQPDNGSPAAVQALAAAIEARDNYTHAHSEQVVALATDVARLLGLSPAEVEAVRHGALLHDVGKLAIPNEILHKPGPLTDAEWLVMAEHPVIGERILRRTPRARPSRADRAPRARALGRRRLPRRPGRHGDPDRLAHHPRLRRLQRDDHHAPLPRGDVRTRTRSRSCATRRAPSSTRRSSRRCSRRLAAVSEAASAS